MTTVTRSTSVVLVQTATTGGNTIVTFPNISTIGRLITVRDNDGYASTGNAIILTTTAGASFTGVSGTLAINQPFGFITLNSQANGAYSVVNSFAFPSGSTTANVSNLVAQTISVQCNIFVGSTIQIADRGLTQTNTIFASSSILYINNSSIGTVTNPQLASTVNGLGSAGYLSSIPNQFPIPPVWVAVGRSNAATNTSSMQYSMNATTWCNTRGPQQGFFYEGRAVAYYNSLWVAVGDNTFPASSPNLGYNQWSVDGSNWQYSYSPLLADSEVRYDVHYANGLWHSVGKTGGNGGPRTILWSTDGKNWNPSQGTPFNNSPLPEGYAYGVTFGNGVWVVAGAAGNTPASNCVWSTNGSNWNPATNVAWTSTDIRDVHYDGTKFIAIPKNGSNAAASNIAMSTDGRNWTSAGITGGNLNNNQQFVVGNGNQWLIVSTQPGSNLLQSLDGGFTWQNNANITNFNVSMGRPYWDGSKWFIGIQTGLAQNNIYYSTDGITWLNSAVTSQYTNNSFPWGFASSDGQSNLSLLLISTTLGYSYNFNTSNLNASTINTNTLNASTINTSNISSTYLRLNQFNMSIGSNAGITQGLDAIAIGRNAGTTNQGQYAVGIGYQAGQTNQPTNSIILNASGSVLNGTTPNSLYIDPIRSQLNTTGKNILYYDNSSKEITSGYELISSFPSISTGTIQAASMTVSSLFINVVTVSTTTITSNFVSTLYFNNANASTATISTINANYISAGTILTGNMGIGLNNPSYALDVSGSARINSLSTNSISTGTIYTDYISANSVTIWGSNTLIVQGSTILEGAVYVSSLMNVSTISTGSITGSNASFKALDVNGQINVNNRPTNVAWVAVGEITNSILYSSNGTDWSPVSGNPFGTGGIGYGVAWNGQLWVAVGDGDDTILHSTNGINWTGVGDPFGGQGIGVAWNGQLWVAVGSGTNTILYSTNGINWTGVGDPFGGQGIGVAWNGQLWVAVGSGTNRIVYSTNGTSWSGAGDPFGGGGYGNGVAWNGQLWVAVGSGATNSILYSTDGINWTGLGDPFGSGTGQGVAWNGQLWVAVGGGTNRIVYSTDGINWTGIGDPFGGGGIGYGVAWNGQLWVAVGSGTNTILYSTNGINWSSAVNSFDFGRGVAAYRNPDIQTQNLTISGQNQPYFIQSTNQINTSISSIIINNTLYTTLDTKVGINVPLPQYTLDINGSARMDSISTSVLTTTGLTTMVNKPTQPLWVAVGSGSGTIKYSYDGLNWLLSPSSFTNNGNDAAWNGLMWVAVGNGGAINETIKYSYDGITWTSVSNGFSTSGNGIAWNGRMWIAVGEGGNTIRYSYDGINWSSISVFSTRGSGIAWNGRMWVATGQGGASIGYSYDGINWTAASAFSLSGRGIAWNGRMWVATGFGGSIVRYSYNGINWTSASASFATIGGKVAWNGQLWVAVGTGGSTIGYSYDGITWSNSSSGFTTDGYAVAWNGQIWVAGGYGTNTIKYSYDGINWSNSLSGEFTFSTTGVAYSSNVTPDIQLQDFTISGQNQPYFIQSTNQINTSISSIILNNTLYTTNYNKVGINVPLPQYTLDINGSARMNSISTNSISTGTIYTDYISANSVTIWGSNTLFVQGSTIMTGALNVTSDTTINGSLNVTGGITSGVVGSILMYGGSSAPTGWLLCNGTSYAAATYPNLYAVIGITYGVGIYDFQVPDLRQRVPVGSGGGYSLGTSNSINQSTITLTSNQLPVHSHTLSIALNSGNSGGDPGSTQWGGNNDWGVKTYNGSTNDAGGGQSVNIMNPYVVINYIIKY